MHPYHLFRRTLSDPAVLIDLAKYPVNATNDQEVDGLIIHVRHPFLRFGVVFAAITSSMVVKGVMVDCVH